MSSSPTTAEKIRSAEDTVTKAQSALDAAQKGLHAARDMVTSADRVRSNPWAKAGAAAFLGMIVVALVLMMKNRGELS